MAPPLRPLIAVEASTVYIPMRPDRAECSIRPGGLSDEEPATRAAVGVEVWSAMVVRQRRHKGNCAGDPKLTSKQARTSIRLCAQRVLVSVETGIALGSVQRTSPRWSSCRQVTLAKSLDGTSPEAQRLLHGRVGSPAREGQEWIGRAGQKLVSADSDPGVP